MKFFATSSCCGIKWLLVFFVVDVSSFVSVASMQSVLCLLCLYCIVYRVFFCLPCFYCIVYKPILVKIGFAKNLMQDLLFQ